MSVQPVRILDSIYGIPTLVSANNGKANWVRGSTSPLDQKSSTGWLAYLYGGVQTGDDWARVNIPVFEQRVPDFKTAQWSYYMSATETMGVNIVIWAHDPKDYDKRAEITQRGNVSGLEKTSGWNAHELDITTDQFFYYGENVTSASGTATALTAGTLYGWDDFQADDVFKTWTIYRITFEYGWEASGTFDDAYVADIKLNGMPIRLGPENGTHKRDVLTTKTIVGGAMTANDVISENASTGTDWDFDFGGTGHITKGIVTIATNGLTERLLLWLFSTPPTGVVNDNVASNSPVAADIPYLVGYMGFDAMTDTSASGPSYTIATVSTGGNLPIPFDAPVLYGILVGLDGGTLGNVLCSIHLFAEMEDN